MEDEITGAAQETSEGEGKNTEAAKGGATATQTAGEGQGEQRFTQADLDRKVNERLAEERKRQEKRDAEAEAKRRGDFEALLKSRDEENETLRAELARRDHEALQRQVADKVGLPTVMASRLRGNTESELEADAKELLKVTAKANGALPPAGGRNPGGGSENSPEKTKQQLRSTGLYRT